MLVIFFDAIYKNVATPDNDRRHPWLQRIQEMPVKGRDLPFDVSR